MRKSNLKYKQINGDAKKHLWDAGLNMDEDLSPVHMVALQPLELLK